MKKTLPTVVPSRIVAAREFLKWSQADLADAVGMTQQAIGAIEKGGSKRPGRLFDISQALGVEMDYLLGLQDNPTPEEGQQQKTRQFDNAATVRIPDLAIFGGLGGGGMLEVMADQSGALIDEEQLRGYWSFPEYMVSGFRHLRQIYAWEVRGDSMEPTLAGGSVVFVDMSQDKLPPEDIYAIDYGDGLMVKRLKLIPRSDKVAVISDNERYGTDELLRDEVRVYGRIVGWFQWRK